MLPAALILGASAVQAGRMWLDRQMDDRLRSLAEAVPAQPQLQTAAFGTIVVAAAPLRYGAEITRAGLKEIAWPGDQTPAGAFAHVADVISGPAKRGALSAIEPNEPILSANITGPDQKANLAAIIEPGKKALTVRVDDVVGVAGFVLPGDRVDVLLTRQPAKGEATADNILQNVKVLAVDQMVDDKSAKPTVARAVTLQVSTEQAQRLIVAQNVGSLTLTLRPLGQSEIESVRQVSSVDLTKVPPTGTDSHPNASARNSSVTVTVIRSMARTEYNVPTGEAP